MKTTLKKLVVALLLGMVTMAASAQRGYQVKGVVVDAEGPVAGATVVEKEPPTAFPLQRTVHSQSRWAALTPLWK